MTYYEALFFIVIGFASGWTAHWTWNKRPRKFILNLDPESDYLCGSSKTPETKLHVKKSYGIFTDENNNQKRGLNQ